MQKRTSLLCTLVQATQIWTLLVDFLWMLSCKSKCLNSWPVIIWYQNPRKQMDSHGQNVLNSFPCSHVPFHCFPAKGKSGAPHISPLGLCLTHATTQDPVPQNGGCSVLLTWAERWGQDVLIYNARYCDLQQQSNCCGDKRKQSAAHPHTAGYCWTKEDYLHWYKKQSILFLKLKINPANIYFKHLNR